MNPWMKDPRVEKAAVDAFEAERAERRGSRWSAGTLPRGAERSLVALSVPAAHPNTGATSNRGGRELRARGCPRDAGEVARRVRAESDALTGLVERVLRLLREYEGLIAEAGRSFSFVDEAAGFARSTPQVEEGGVIRAVPSGDLGLDLLLGGGFRLVKRLPDRESATVLVRGGAGRRQDLGGSTWHWS